MGVSRDCPFFGYPLLSQELEKLRISNFTSTFRGSIRIKAHEKFWRKRAWAYPGTAQIFWVPLSGLSQEGEKLRISNLARTFRGSIRIKAHEKFWRKGSVGVSRDCPNFLGIPYYLRNWKSYVFQIWQVYSEGPSEHIPLQILEKRERGPIQGLPVFRVPLIIPGTAEAAIFKFAQ